MGNPVGNPRVESRTGVFALRAAQNEKSYIAKKRGAYTFLPKKLQREKARLLCNPSMSIEKGPFFGQFPATTMHSCGAGYIIGIE